MHCSGNTNSVGESFIPEFVSSLGFYRLVTDSILKSSARTIHQSVVNYAQSDIKDGVWRSSPDFFFSFRSR